MGVLNRPADPLPGLEDGGEVVVLVMSVVCVCALASCVGVCLFLSRKLVRLKVGWIVHGLIQSLPCNPSTGIVLLTVHTASAALLAHARFDGIVCLL